ncbi:low-density lipoprotein receptor class A domain-containing protein 2 isoform X2 [Xiphophorus couchianus]|uniref:low-density lipoprotein receptor class A domain-containing protein 2 isoform X2 n=1 Tax=Xiphophorus couchianus TaxID=32473 RepID=UPI001016C580|nr:low-density lipoprotein receptor class A domain-containing protein 2 isoform X2 [Xiphophorus couchianus]
MMGLKPPNRYLLLLLCFNSLCCSAIESVNLVDFCGQTIRRDGMIVKSHQESKKYYFVTMGTDCHLTMQASSPKDKVQFYFRFFLVYSLLRVAPLSPAPLVQESSRSSTFLNSRLDPTSGGSPEDPCYAGSYLQFYDGRDRSSPALGPPLCGKTAPRPVLSTGNYLTLRLVTRGTQPRVDFVGDFTSFRLGFNQSECRSEPYFTCRNGKCIPVSLVCDDKDVDNCGDGSDLEENLTGCKGQLSSTERPPQISTPTLSLVSLPTHVGGRCMNCSVTRSSVRRESVTGKYCLKNNLFSFFTPDSRNIATSKRPLGRHDWWIAHAPKELLKPYMFYIARNKSTQIPISVLAGLSSWKHFIVCCEKWQVYQLKTLSISDHFPPAL